VNEATRRWRKENRDRHYANKKRHYLKNRDRILLKWRLKVHGISVETWNSLLKDQGNKCASCGRDGADSMHGHLYIDHCHATDRVRGLLCNQCNIALGHSHDDCSLIESAIEYLADPPAKRKSKRA